MKKILFATIILAHISVFGQEYIISENVQADTTDSDFGPNQKHYWHSYIRYGFIALLDNQPELVESFKSRETSIGMRYKRKFTELLSGGIDFFYTNQRFAINQSNKQFWIDTLVYNKEKLNLQNLGTALFFRINTSRRGDVIGKYLDVGGYGSYAIGIKRTIEDKIPFSPWGETSYKNTIKGANYLNRFNYGVFARVGINFFVLNFRYRLSQLIINNQIPEFPRFSVGIELDILD
jgi:hypothetical protein